MCLRTMGPGAIVAVRAGVAQRVVWVMLLWVMVFVVTAVWGNRSPLFPPFSLRIGTFKRSLGRRMSIARAMTMATNTTPMAWTRPWRRNLCH